jgi:hypothetical protein
MSQLQRYLSQINFDSFRFAAIEKVTTGATTVAEVLRVLPHSALYRKSWVELEAVPSGDLMSFKRPLPSENGLLKELAHP